VLGVLLMAACSATGPVYQAAPTPEEASVLVYLFRPSRFAMGTQDAHFSVDGVEVASLSTGGYPWLHASGKGTARPGSSVVSWHHHHHQRLSARELREFITTVGWHQGCVFS
jgi:hypothetical protein